MSKSKFARHSIATPVKQDGQSVKSLPKVGDDIYVTSAMYMSHGVDDRVGGLAKVTKVTDRNGNLMVEVAEFPRTSWNWGPLAEQQDSLKAEFGKNRAYPDPDNSPESNRWD